MRVTLSSLIAIGRKSKWQIVPNITPSSLSSGTPQYDCTSCRFAWPDTRSSLNESAVANVQPELRTNTQYEASTGISGVDNSSGVLAVEKVQVL